MTFAQTIDPRWHRRRSASHRIGRRGLHPSHAYHDHASIVRALPFSDGIAALPHPTAGAVAEQKQPNRTETRGLVLSLPLRRVEHASFGRLDDLSMGSTSDVPGMVPQSGRGQQQEGGANDWREGLLGYGARVLALSMYSDK